MTQIEVYAILFAARDRRMTAREITQEVGDLNHKTVQDACRRLHDNGCIERDEGDKRGAFRYWINNDIRE